MTRNFYTLLLINFAASLMMASAIDTEAIRLSLQSNDQDAQRHALKLLSQDVQSSISGVAGQSASEILAPARQQLAPFKTDILALASSPDSRVRTMVAYLLPLVPPGADTDHAMVKLANDPDQEVIATAVASFVVLPQLSNDARSAVLSVIEKRSSVTAVRFATEVAVKNHMDEVIPILAVALNDPNPEMQVEAAKSLARFEKKASGQLGALKELESQSKNETVKLAAQDAIQEIKQSP